jgi:GTP-binding protein
MGKLKFCDGLELNVADLPGLVEGAHQNKGLGHKFLKHIERTKILLFLLDGSLDPYEKRSPLNDLNSLLNELSLYNLEYKNKPFLIALNKCDLQSDNYKTNYELLSNHNILQGKEIIQISGKDGNGLEKLTLKIKEIVEQIEKL